jgi:hypothetical protein
MANWEKTAHVVGKPPSLPCELWTPLVQNMTPHKNAPITLENKSNCVIFESVLRVPYGPPRYSGTDVKEKGPTLLVKKRATFTDIMDTQKHGRHLNSFDKLSLRNQIF